MMTGSIEEHEGLMSVTLRDGVHRVVAVGPGKEVL